MAGIIGGVIGLVIGLIACVVIAFLPHFRAKRAQNDANKIINDANIKAEKITKSAQLDAKQTVYEMKQEAEKDIKERKQEVVIQENKLLQREQSIDARDAQLMRKEQSLEDKEKHLDKLNEEAKKKNAFLQEKVDSLLGELEKVANMTEKEARDEIFNRVKEKEALNIAKYIKEQEEKAESIADEKSRDILALAMARHAQEVTTERTINVINLPNDEMKGRIIGREGRNIKSLEQSLGVDILIDDIVAANGDYLIEEPEVNPYAMADYKFRQDVALEGIKHRNRMKEAQEEADNFAALMPAGPQSLNQGDVATQQGDSAANLEREVVNAKLRYYGGWLQKNKSKKGSKDYNKIQSLYNWWKDAGTNAGRKKLYKVDSEGRWMPTSRFKAAVDNYNKTYVKYHKLTPGQVTTRYMNNNTVHYTGPQAEIIRNWFGGETEQIPNTDLKYKTINFGDAGTQLTKVRTTSLSGAPLTRGSISVAFNKYLKDNRVKGYIVPGDVRTGRSVNRSGRGNYTDVYYTALIPESAFNNFKEKQKSLGKIVDEGKLEKTLGVVRMNLGSYKTPGGAIAERIVYAVPVSTSIQDRYMSTYNDELNDKSLYGQSKTWTTATENRQPLAGYRINWQ